MRKLSILVGRQIYIVESIPKGRWQEGGRSSNLNWAGNAAAAASPPRKRDFLGPNLDFTTNDLKNHSLRVSRYVFLSTFQKL